VLRYVGLRLGLRAWLCSPGGLRTGLWKWLRQWLRPGLRADLRLQRSLPSRLRWWREVRLLVPGRAHLPQL
jgi:hypothetical protein